jgi:hypothetical protein
MKCINCDNIIEDCEAEYCCNGRDCGCMGKPINYPDFLCDDCLTKGGWTKVEGITVEGE